MVVLKFIILPEQEKKIAELAEKMTVDRWQEGS